MGMSAAGASSAPVVEGQCAEPAKVGMARDGGAVERIPTIADKNRINKDFFTTGTTINDESTEDEVSFSDEDEDSLGRHQDSDSDDFGGPVSPGVAELREALRTEAAIGRELEEVGQEGLVDALAKVLTHLASLGGRPHRATVFHAARVPQMSIQDYLVRLAKYYHCSDGCLLLALIYIDRLVKLHPDFVISNLNIHRLMSVSLMLAAKFQDDVFYKNSYYAKVAGLNVLELNRLEEKFLQLLRWQMSVLPSEYEEYLGRVLHPLRLRSL